MANNYVQTSLKIALTVEQQEYAEMVYNKLWEEGDKLNEFQEEILSDPDYPSPGFDFEREKDGIWLSEDEFADVTAIGKFLFHIVNKFQLKPIGFTWSESSSKLRVDEFTGGCCIVSQNAVDFWNATDQMNVVLKMAGE